MKNAPRDKKGRRITPESIKKEIEKIETAIETTVRSFDQEQKLMKKMKELKKQYAELSMTTTGSKDLSALRKKINSERKEADKLHKEIQEKAKLSQDLHEQILELSKKIEEMRKAQADAHEKFLSAKKEFQEINNQLKKKLEEYKAAGGEAQHIRDEKRHQKEEKKEKSLAEKLAAVQKKIEAGEKLTTEDILVLQSEDSDEF